jgi:hypothetical protein
VKRFGLGLAVLFTLAAPAQATPITQPGGGTYDLLFSVESGFNAVPGAPFALTAQLQNTGTLPIRFQNWNRAQPGGYGFNFNAANWAIGLGSTSGDFYRAPGTGEPNFSQAQAQADFSELSGVTIAPGATLSFTLYTLLLDTSTPIGKAVDFKTNVEFTHGGGVIEGWASQLFDSGATAGTQPRDGGFLPVGLTNKDPFTPRPVGTPEPGSMALAGVGMLFAVSRRRLRR